MKNRLLKTAVAFLFAVAMSFSINARQALALGNFSQSCSDYYIYNSKLYAFCEQNNSQSLSQTSIDLNVYIANVDGVLEWQPDNFTETCRNLQLHGASELTADCQTGDGSWASSKLDLDEHIANINGVLMYQ